MRALWSSRPGRWRKYGPSPGTAGEKGRLEAGGAALLSRLSKAALDQGLTGLEFAQGIPGAWAAG